MVVALAKCHHTAGYPSIAAEALAPATTPPQALAPRYQQPRRGHQFSAITTRRRGPSEHETLTSPAWHWRRVSPAASALGDLPGLLSHREGPTQPFSSACQKSIAQRSESTSNGAANATSIALNRASQRSHRGSRSRGLSNGLTWIPPPFSLMATARPAPYRWPVAATWPKCVGAGLRRPGRPSCTWRRLEPNQLQCP